MAGNRLILDHNLVDTSHSIMPSVSQIVFFLSPITSSISIYPYRMQYNLISTRIFTKQQLRRKMAWVGYISLGTFTYSCCK